MLLYPSSRSLFYDNRPLAAWRLAVVAIVAIVGKTTAMRVGRTGEHVGGGYGHNAGKKC